MENQGYKITCAHFSPRSAWSPHWKSPWNLQPLFWCRSVQSVCRLFALEPQHTLGGTMLSSGGPSVHIAYPRPLDKTHLCYVVLCVVCVCVCVCVCVYVCVCMCVCCNLCSCACYFRWESDQRSGSHRGDRGRCEESGADENRAEMTKGMMRPRVQQLECACLFV